MSADGLDNHLVKVIQSHIDHSHETGTSRGILCRSCPCMHCHFFLFPTSSENVEYAGDTKPSV